MKRNISKKAKKRLIVFGIPCIFVIIYFIGQLLFYSYKIYDLKQTQNKLNNQMEKLKEDEKEKNRLLEKYSTDEGKANFAREEFSYTKKDEYKIVIKEDEEKEENNLSFKDFIIEKIKNLDYDYAYIIFGMITIIIIIIIISSKKKDD